ncbi:hypothetical protein ATCC90586_008797 [Pythium insidiosum]|nr:hypothetical protein ATCC90586_008797 [Pythium insidiosum]
MSILRRSQSVASNGAVSLPARNPSTMAGFIRLESSPPSSPVMSGSPRRKRSSSTGSNSGSSSSNSSGRWLYAVLSRDVLRCYARRADVKLQATPVNEVQLDLLPTASNPTPFSFDQDCLYVRCRRLGRVVTVRLHDNTKIHHWVTALYYQALAASSAAVSARAASKPKSVSFTETPKVSVLPMEPEPVDKAELFYSKRDYQEFFQRWKADSAEPASTKSALYRLVERCR